MNSIRYRRLIGAFAPVAMSCLLAGCGSDPLGRQAIEGTVTLDGAPLSHGNVRFEPLEAGDGTAAGAVIDEGSFHIPAEQGLSPGRYRVSISCPGELLLADPSADEGGLAQELVPARYNSETTLEITVSGDAKNQFPFDLSTAE